MSRHNGLTDFWMMAGTGARSSEYIDFQYTWRIHFRWITLTGRHPSAKGTPLFVLRLRLVDQSCLLCLLVCAFEYPCEFGNMGDVEGNTVPLWLVFTAFVRPPGSKDNDIA